MRRMSMMQIRMLQDTGGVCMAAARTVERRPMERVELSAVQARGMAPPYLARHEPGALAFMALSQPKPGQLAGKRGIRYRITNGESAPW